MLTTELLFPCADEKVKIELVGSVLRDARDQAPLWLPGFSPGLVVDLHVDMQPLRDDQETTTE